MRLDRLCSDVSFCEGTSSLRDVKEDLDVRVVASLCLPMDLADAVIYEPCPKVVRSVALRHRLVGDFVENFPGMQALRRIRTEFGIQALPRARGRTGGAASARTEQTYEDILLELPPNANAPKRKREDEESKDDDFADEEDPIRLMSGLNFRQYLRSGHFFSKAMAASHKFDNPTAPPRESTGDPARSTFDRAAARLDHVDMLIERRQFHADRITDSIAAIFCILTVHQ